MKKVLVHHCTQTLIFTRIAIYQKFLLYENPSKGMFPDFTKAQIGGKSVLYHFTRQKEKKTIFKITERIIIISL